MTLKEEPVTWVFDSYGKEIDTYDQTRMITRDGNVVDIQQVLGVELDLFISQEDKRDTEKIKVFLSPHDAERLALALLNHADRLRQRLALRHESNPPVLDLPWVPRPKNEEIE